MKSLHLFLALLFAYTLTSINSHAQQDSTKLNTLLSKIKRLTDEQPVEKVYLHFDKPYYAVADTMWFKAYLTIEQNLPSPFSKIIYVEVLNARDSIVQMVKLPVKNSVAYGNIPLGMKNFKQGNYYVRAYTIWMLNFGSDYFFTKNIPIGEAIDKEILTTVSYINETVDKNIKTTAKIQFRDLDKKVHANKVVNWTIESNRDVFTKGRGTTDQNGVLNISVTSKDGNLISNGVILTTLTASEKENISASFDLKQTANVVDFQFFPEGGSFVSGIPNQVGFKAVGANGLGVEIKGNILGEDNASIVAINSSHAGMGSFYLTPEEGKSYTAKVTFKDGSSKTYPLPQATSSGISLQVSGQTEESVNVKVIANGPYFEANKGKAIFIVAQSNNVVYYAAKVNLGNQLLSIKIPKNDFPAGVVQLTLFNSDNVPLGERLVFFMPKNNTKVTVKTDLPAYKARQKVKMSVNTGAEGDYSVSVIDEQKVPVDETTETTILSSLLLTSDLKGYVEKPNFYFTKTDEKKQADLDKLMLTQGYRRFLYKDILADKYPMISYLPEQGISLSGTLRDLTGMPIKKGSLRLMVTGKPISAELLTSNSGLFNFQNLVFPDSSEVVISAKYNPNAANLMIMMDGLPLAMTGKNKNVFDDVTNIDTSLSSYLANSQRQYRYLRTLKEVVIKGPSTVKKVSHRDHPALTSLGQNADHLIDGSVFANCVGNLLDCIKVRASGMTFDQEKFYVTRDYNSGSRVPVQVYLNNFPVDARDIMSVNVAELESVEIFLTDQLGTIDRLHNTRGVLVINTKKVATLGTKISKQEFFDLIPKKNIITINPMGYSKEREFYSPKYLPNATIANADLRTTIYWNPKVVTDSTGNASFEFFNADGKGSYRAIVEGIDKKGNIGRTVYRYKVN
ncbi:MAG: carboxypeptidase regulatory-like domain-containing protein [Pedobacter sp.]|nr:MAG: carboxypeptidase regulatory-like domain-containing protein [Pedobacter sp.]